MHKVCTKCGEVKPSDRFVPCKENKSGVRSYCKDCNNAYYAKRRIEKYELVRSYEKKFHYERKLKYEYNTTKEHIEELRIKQNNRCAICKQESKLVIDHCHTEGHVRGLLCTWCNTGLGQFKDNIKSLKEAIKYLETKRLPK